MSVYEVMTVVQSIYCLYNGIWNQYLHNLLCAIQIILKIRYILSMFSDNKSRQWTEHRVT